MQSHRLTAQAIIDPDMHDVEDLEREFIMPDVERGISPLPPSSPPQYTDDYGPEPDDEDLEYMEQMDEPWDDYTGEFDDIDWNKLPA